MKQSLILIFILPAVIFYSCEVPLNPNAPFRQRYVLTGIMRNDTSVQVITLARSYMTSTGINPASDTVDPAVTDAEVNIWYRDTLYQLRDSAVIRTDTSQYKDSVHFYYVKNLRPAPGEYLDIEAVMPNGILLQSSTQMPNISDYDFFDSKTNLTISYSLIGGLFHVGWAAIANVYYQPRVVINYYEKGSTEIHTKRVPLYYITENGVQTPYYPLQTKINFFNIDTSVINTALNEIPQNGLSKSNYTIANIDVQIIIYDEHLSTYFSSITEGINAFTVQVDLPDYSNIKGGYGIFCSYVKTDLTVKFNSYYLRDLGYYP